MPEQNDDQSSGEFRSVELKNPGTAALLAWLVPGAGHLYQGRTAKGVIAMACLVPMFLAGMYFGGGRVAYASSLPLTKPTSFIADRWQFICQAGIGAVAIPAMLERTRYQANPLGSPLFKGGYFRPPRTGSAAVRGPEITSIDHANNKVIHPDELAKWNYDYGFYFELGTVYTMIAGLMNILVVYDAYSGPLQVVDPKKAKKDIDPDGANPDGDKRS